MQILSAGSGNNRDSRLALIFGLGMIGCAIRDKLLDLEYRITEEIDLIINPPEKTIAGDYMLTVRVSSENSNDSIDIRVTVLTPTIWGWVGIGIIVIVVIGVAVIFARLGRR